MREKLRQNSLYAEADDMRDKIISKGYSIDDTESGYLIKRRKK